MTRIGSTLFLLLWSVFARAGVEVSATVDTNRLSLGEALTYSINVETTDSVGIGNPRLPDLEGFNIVNKYDGLQSRSTFVNGQFQFLQTYNFSFVLSPIKQGRLIIGASEIVVGGQTYKTQPITIDVAAPGAGSQAPRQRQAQPRQQQPPDPVEDDPFFKDADDLFSQLLQRRGLNPQGGVRTKPVNEDEAFFIQLEVDKTEVYEGEQVTASYYLMTPFQVRDIDTLKYPSLRGFWKEDIEVATRLNFQREIINGVAYNKALLASYALFPLKAGKASIDPYKARCTIVTNLNMLGMGTPYQYTKASQPVSVVVKSLPKDNQPKDFSGAVGQFTLSARLDAAGSKLPINQPFSLKLRLDGRGNAKVVELPPIELPPDLETYDTKTESKFSRDGTSFKEFELLLIPRRQGTFTIPSISISSFDPTRRQYIQSKTNPITIQVGEGRGGETYQTSPLSLTEKKSEPNKRELPPPMLEMQASTTLPAPFWPIVWAIVFGGGLSGLYLRARNVLGWGEKKRGLKERALKRLKQAQRVSEYRKLGSEGVNIINMVLGELSHDGVADAQFEKLILKAPPSVRRELEGDLRDLVTYFESLAFAPDQLALQLAGSAKDQMRKLEKTVLRAIDIGLERTTQKTV